MSEVRLCEMGFGWQLTQLVVFTSELLLVQMSRGQMHLYASRSAAFSCDWAKWCKVCLIHSFLGLLLELHLTQSYPVICQPDPYLVWIDWLLRLGDDLSLDLDRRSSWSLSTIHRAVIEGVDHELLCCVVEDAMVLLGYGCGRCDGHW